MDQKFTSHSFQVVLDMHDFLRVQGYPVNKERVRRIMRLMGPEAEEPRPCGPVQ